MLGDKLPRKLSKQSLFYAVRTGFLSSLQKISSKKEKSRPEFSCFGRIICFFGFYILKVGIID